MCKYFIFEYGVFAFLREHYTVIICADQFVVAGEEKQKETRKKQRETRLARLKTNRGVTVGNRI